MRPDVVVDVGNSRIKWGRVGSDRIVESVSLPPEDPGGWQQQLSQWKITERQKWAIGGVDPARCSILTEWLKRQGHEVLLLDSWRLLGMRLDVEQPDSVGLDRLFDALAATKKCAHDMAIIVDAGSAVTVDSVSGDGIFRGGAIFPGLGLMSNALHDYTAKLPLVQLDASRPELPGRSTMAAIKAGIFWSIVGGIRAIIEELSLSLTPRVFITGGDAQVVASAGRIQGEVWPAMTLEGILLAAEKQP